MGERELNSENISE